MHKHSLEIKLYQHFRKQALLIKLETLIVRYKGIVVFVGGCIRNIILNITPSDYDIEVFLLTKEKLAMILTQFATSINEHVIYAGVKFGVFKISGINIDISMPRQEKSIGSKHTDFAMNIQPQLNYYKASHRRDFKINSIGYSTYYRVVLDPNNGIQDIKHKVINITSTPATFLEDPLRILRAIYFANKLQFRLNDTLTNVIQQNSHLLQYISIERIANEIYKTLNSVSIKYLYYFNFIKYDNIMINTLKNIVQNEIAFIQMETLDSLKSRLFFLLLHQYSEALVSFILKMPNHKTFKFNAIQTLTSIYYYSYVNKNTKMLKINIRKVKQKEYHYNIKQVLICIKKHLIFTKYIHQIEKIITLYLHNINTYIPKYKHK